MRRLLLASREYERATDAWLSAVNSGDGHRIEQARRNRDEARRQRDALQEAAQKEGKK